MSETFSNLKEKKNFDPIKIEENQFKTLVYEDFISILSSNNIRQFNLECKNKHLDIKTSKKNSNEGSSRLSKDSFMNIMLHVFSKDYRKEEKKDMINSSSVQTHTTNSPIKKDDTKDKILISLCEKMFNRFKSVKCEIKTEKQKSTISSNNLLNNNTEYYYINDISNDQQEIETYEFTCALCIFLKVEFKEKMRLLFDITDADEDGYVNKAEIKNMIFTVNYIFSDEETPLKSNSSILNQSLATIKSQQIFDMIMKYPGQLFRVINVEKYVDFDQFYSSIEKIENFKYSIIPSFINFKNCLYTRKTEPEFEIERRNLNDFLVITNEIVANVRNTNNELVKTNKDIKKLIELRSESKFEKATKKKRNYVEENIKNSSKKKLRTNSLNVNLSKNNSNVSVNKKNNVEIDYYFSENTNSNTNLPVISNMYQKDNNRSPGNNNKRYHNNTNYININTNYFSPSESYNINYNKINNLDAQPGKIKIKDGYTIPVTKDNLTSVNRTENSTLDKDKDSREIYKNTFSRVLHNTQKDLDKKKTFVAYEDIMGEIKSLSNKNSYANNEDNEEILKLNYHVKEAAGSLINKLKDTGGALYLSLTNYHFKKAAV